MSINKKQKIVRNQFGLPYTQEQRSWAVAYYKDHTKKELWVAFNKKYGTSKSLSAISHLVDRKPKGAWVLYTEEQKDFIKRQVMIPNNTWKNITKYFNEKFGTNKRWEALKRISTDMGYITGSNRDKNFTYYPKERYKIGTEIIHNNKGTDYVYVKVDNKHNGDNWKLKQHIVWEQAHGKIPKHHTIAFLDGNTLNCELSNLMLVDNKTFYNIVAHKYYGKNELTQAFCDVVACKRKIEELQKEIE